MKLIWKLHFTNWCQLATVALPIAVFYLGGWQIGQKIPARYTQPELVWVLTFLAAFFLPLLCYLIMEHLFLRQTRREFSLSGNILLVLYKRICEKHGFAGGFTYVLYYASILLLAISICTLLQLETLHLLELSFLIWVISGLVMRKMLYGRVSLTPGWITAYAILILLPLSGAGILIGGGLNQMRQVEAAKGKLRAMGGIATLKELADEYGKRDYPGTQVRVKIMQICDTMDFKPWVALYGKLLNEPTPAIAEDYQAAEKYLDENKELIQLLDEFGKYDKVSFDRKWEDGINMSIKHDIHLRQLTRINDARMLLAARSGNAAEVIRLFHATGNLRSQLTNEPLTICGMIGHYVESMRLKTLNQIMNSGMKFSIDELKGIIRDLEAADTELRENLRINMQSEAQQALTLRKELMMHDIPSNDPAQVVARIYFSSWLVKPFDFWAANMDRNALMDCWVEFYRDIGKNYYQLSQRNKEGSRYPIAAFVSKMMLSSIHLIRQRVHVCNANQRALEILCAVELYHAKYQKYPDSIDQLAPEFLAQIPVDTFDGKPMRYLNGPDRITVYSVGPNGKDEHGDIVFDKGYKDVGYFLLKNAD